MHGPLNVQFQNIVLGKQGTQVVWNEESDTGGETSESLDLLSTYGARGGLVVKALSYKPAGRRFDFSVT
jgi:hypothetical protein